MGRGNSCGGDQSSLNYLFGGGDAPAAKPAPAPRSSTALTTATTSVEPAELNKQIPAGIKTPVNNYARAEGQNTRNFLTICLDRPSTQVHAAGSSLDYLFMGSK